MCKLNIPCKNGVVANTEDTLKLRFEMRMCENSVWKRYK